MRTQLQIFSIIFLTSLNLFGQAKLPKNLKQAVHYLEKNTPDLVKHRIETISQDSLIYSVYPFAETEPFKSYETISNWANDGRANPKIKKYLQKKGIRYYHFQTVLYAFREYLQNGKINEKQIIEKFANKQKKVDQEDELKFITDTIDGVYIPKNLEDCFAQIDLLWDDNYKMQVKNMEEEEFASSEHFEYGMWLRNNWGLWNGSRLYKYFSDLGISHADDMSGIILDSYHRYLNNKQIKLEEQIQDYKSFWQESSQERLKEMQQVFSQYKIGDTLKFNYTKGFVSKKQENKYADDTCSAKGIVTQRNEREFLIKVKIIETCDKKGVIFFDNAISGINSPKTERWNNSGRHIIKKVKKNKEQWFEYRDWDILEK